MTIVTGHGYVWVAARSLRSQGFTVNVQQLGIPGAVISRTFEDMAIQYGRNDVLANFIQQEVPFVKKEASLVTVFTGANDVNVVTSALGKGAGGADPTGFIDQSVAGFTSDFATLIAGIRARSKSARIVVMNLPNLAGLPYLADCVAGAKAGRATRFRANHDGGHQPDARRHRDRSDVRSALVSVSQPVIGRLPPQRCGL